MGQILSLRNYRQEVIAHSHEHPQVVISLSGKLDFEVDGRASRLHRQHLMVVPAGAHHTCESEQGSQCLVLDVPGEEDWLGQSLGQHADASRRLLDSAAQLSLDPMQHQLVKWLASSAVSDPLISRQGAILLLASLNTLAPDSPPPKRLPLAALDAYIDQNAAYPLQVADLARIAGLSSTRLHSRFISECGQTPMDYIRQRRLHSALSLLRRSRLPIGEVACRVGYTSQSAFAAAMLREFGASPSALRRESGDN
ncbi:AraC family transcriptional regulator [Pseudomonas sp. TMW22089]|uniref:helix-turn-helix transcriptional regulator n=1 Tax=Pseudomonas sp. TMW22089 TaxID=2506433 RepID=UPI001F0E5647|nr:AraC family transcriptional regulator [Pseudomonas sp. TMW22089]MCH4871156.1 AraC family transcriptional regulator [Pseudomonas sp. TMW22089]